MILPSDKKLGSSMSGAFLIWDPLLAFLAPAPVLLAHVLRAMNAPTARVMDAEADSVKEGLCEWALHVISTQDGKIYEDTLEKCFVEPGYWNLRVAEGVLGMEGVRDVEMCRRVLEAARGGKEGDEMEGEVQEVEETRPVVKEKITGPQKVLGMWKPRPIGWMAEGWEEDE